jgi:hypothetical protein
MSTFARHLPCSLLLAVGLGVGVATVGCPGDRAPPRRIDQLDDPDRSVGPGGEDIPINDGSKRPGEPAGGDFAPEQEGQDPIPGD